VHLAPTTIRRYCSDCRPSTRAAESCCTLLYFSRGQNTAATPQLLQPASARSTATHVCLPAKQVLVYCTRARPTPQHMHSRCWQFIDHYSSTYKYPVRFHSNGVQVRMATGCAVAVEALLIYQKVQSHKMLAGSMIACLPVPVLNIIEQNISSKIESLIYYYHERNARFAVSVIVSKRCIKPTSPRCCQ
jgi:hypothetical protein